MSIKAPLHEHVGSTTSNPLEIFKTSCELDSLSARVEGRRSPDVYDSLSGNAIWNALSVDQEVHLYGYLGNRVDVSKKLSFAQIHDPTLRWKCQLVGSVADAEAFQALRAASPNSVIAVTGIVKEKHKPKSESLSQTPSPSAKPVRSEVEVHLTAFSTINEFPRSIILNDETIFPPEQRHLQIRANANLRQALALRAKVQAVCRQHLTDPGRDPYLEIETPLLFKSTPEGAREFLVPTRRPGMAYALPQSPQQYKQILMASGIPKYFQFAKCFRDEDLRADRQPEFTQLDIEQSFSTSRDVRRNVEDMIRAIWSDVKGIELAKEFSVMTYEEAMSTYGSDKPDLRLGMEIAPVGHLLPVDAVAKLSNLTSPKVDALKLSLGEGDPRTTGKFIYDFMESPEGLPFQRNPDGQPGFFIFDCTKPLNGLQVLGFEAAETIEELLQPEQGDAIVLQARPDAPFHGAGSTMMGTLRLALHKAAVEGGLKTLDPDDFRFLWVVDFPLFSPIEDDSADPGQGGSAGLCSTHHPFTSPKTTADVDQMFINPLSCVADHYDLVVNGVELGGGSRRIHSSAVQEMVFRDVLKMSDTRIDDFRHLLEALRAGCPPHAGIALGFDRMVAMLAGRESIRDVIAFPKSGKGEDLMVGSPNRVTKGQLDTYHLQPKHDEAPTEEDGKVSFRA